MSGLMYTRRTVLPELAGASALNTRSQICGVNGFRRIGVQIQFSGTVTAGKISLKYAPNNSAYPVVVSSLDILPTSTANEFVTDSIENAGTNAFLEITTALVGGTIAEAALVLSAE